MTPNYPLSAELSEFVARTLAFTATEPGIRGQRDAYERMCAAFTPPRPSGLEVRDLQLADVPVRQYRHSSSNPQAPGILYLHGGGWAVGSVNSHEFITAALAADLGAVVIAVNYRLAPEHPFPAAFDDCLAVWRAVLAQAPELSIDPQRVVIAGDSAGGNLAAAVCLALRDAGQAQPAGQVLVYPALGGDSNLPSRKNCTDAPLLSSSEVLEYQSLYLPNGGDNAYASPLQAEDFSHLAPAFIAVAEFDPLHDDGLAYAKALQDAGTAVSFYSGQGLIHGCLRARGQAGEVDALYKHILEALAGFTGGMGETL